MAEAAIFFDGKVRQTTNLSDITFNNKSGFVATFTFNQIKYTHLYKDKFNLIDVNSPNVTAGYYDEAKFLKYLVKDGVSINDIPAAKLSLDRISNPVLNDTVRVQYLKVTAPYDDFCTVNKYTWNFDPKAKVLDDRDFTIILQPGYQLVSEKAPLSSVSENFYTKNIGLITSVDFTDNKDQGAYYLSLIALQIHRINRDIFPLFYQSTDLTNYITTQNIEWQTGTIFILPSLQDIVDYLTNLTNFYNAAYANQLVIKAASEKTKLFWLAYCLSPSGLSVFSVYDKIYIITEAISTSKRFALYNVGVSIVLPAIGPDLQVSDAGWVSRISPKLILKIVESVTLAETQSDDFLTQLNRIGNSGINKDETLFEVIYNFLGDNQLGNIIGDNKTGRIVGGIFGTPDDRKNFIEFLKKIWDISIYNPYYNSPKYSLPANNNGVYPESYYMTDAGIQHFNPNTASVLFVFETTDTGDLISYTNSFDFDIERNKIIAYKLLTIQIHDERPTSETNKTLYGSYDLYQPVSIIGYQPDLDIAMPQVNCFPLFFLYYANDYKEVKDADAAIELLFNLALNFTGIGEATDLQYLGYFKQISRFGKLADLPALEPVLSWTAVEGVNSAIQLTAGSVLPISIYVGSTTTDPQLKAFTSKLDLFLGVLCLGSICYHPYVKQRVTFAAIDVNTEYEALKAAYIETNLSEDGIDTFKLFADDELAKALLNFSDNKGLTDALLLLNDANRVRFLNDFGNTPDEFIKLLKTYPKYVNKWAEYTEEEKAFASVNQLKSLEDEIVILRYEELYQRPSSLFPLIDATTILQNFGQNPLKLVNDVETEAANLISTLSKTKRGELVLVSGMVDNETGTVSKLFTNFTETELKAGRAYEQFINSGMQPNLRNRYVQSLEKRGLVGEGYNLANPDDIKYTGLHIGSHAEFRALNYLSIKKFGMDLVDQGVYDLWVKNVFGYNRYLVKEGIMHTCADCFYLTEGVTFIKL